MSRRAALLTWYEQHRRAMPWRESRDPYRIWLSEVMLQQTRVETVVPYFQRFLERFPTVVELAAADLDTVLAVWSGLGYYRRARTLHRAAQAIAAGSEFPRTAAQLAELPGVGPYTAAAVASIAFGEVVPAVDGNVERLVGRLVALEQDPRSAAGRRRVTAAARALLDPRRPGDSNQAMMELGGRVCLPRAPRCHECPLRRGCGAARTGEPQRYPPPRRRPRSRSEERLMAVACRRGRLLLFRRAEGAGHLAGCWELPWVPRGEAAAAALARRYGGSWRLEEAVGRIRHTITTRRLEVELVRARYRPDGGIGEGPEAGWFLRPEIAQLPRSALLEKALRLLEREASPGPLVSEIR